MDTLRRRLTKDEDGFTLIELMVVVLIIAILIAIAIPTFLGAQDRARDRGAQSDLRNALTAAKTIATDDAGKFTNVDAASLGEAEGSLTFVEAAPADTSEIAVEGGSAALAASDDYILFYKESASGTFFGVATSSRGEVKYCKGAVGDVNTAGVGAAPTLTLSGCTDDKW